MLCVFCQGIRLAEIPPFVTNDDDETEKCQLTNLVQAYKHQPNFKSLSLSASRGCQLCVLISEVLLQRQESSGQISNNDDIIYRSVRNEPESALLIQLETDFSAQIYIYRIDGTERQEDAGIFELAIVPTFIYRSPELLVHDGEPDAFFWRALEVWPQTEKSRPSMCQHEEACMKASAKICLFGEAGYAHNRHIASDPSSSSAMNISREWLLACESSHADCSTNVKYAMPTRVIDVGPSDGTLIPRVYLSQGQPGIWATLSHCWGKTVTMTLTFATLEDRMQGISIAALPRNFQDAIIVTRMLNIRYLWIDSLCIIQDSNEDWLKESAEMGEIYKHSFVTIAATNAENSAAGFLQKRIAEFECDIQLKEDVGLHVCIRPRIEWYCSAEIGGPLTKRAWVLQERLLAQRILHFGAQQIMWQCKSKTLAEGFCDTDQPKESQVPEGVEDMLRKQFHAQKKAELALSTTINSSLIRSPVVRGENYNMRDNIYDQWYHVIGKYGTLSLTKQSDKLPAIAGIARQVQTITGDIYLAGLWKSDIERGLQWSYQPPGILIKPSSPRAPSWSWAAPDIQPGRTVEYFNGSVNLYSSTTSHYSKYNHRVKFLSCSPNFTARTCLGNPTPGSITLLGLWIPARIPAAFTDTSATLDPDTQRFALNYPTPLVLAGHARPYAAARLDGDQTGIGTQSVSCLQLGKFECAGRYPREDYISALLLLSQKCVGEDGGNVQRYVRIGLAVLFKSCDLLRGWEETMVEVV